MFDVGFGIVGYSCDFGYFGYCEGVVYGVYCV